MGGGVGDLRLLMPGVQSTWHQDCLLRSMLPHWCLSALIFWPSPTPYHWSVNFVPGLAPLGLSGKHTEISVSDEQEQDLAIMFEPLSKTKIECTLLATQVHGPLRTPPPLLQGCLYMEDDLPCGRGPLLSQWSLGISPLELPNQPLRSWTPLGLKLCFLDLVPSPFLYPRSRDCWPMLPGCARRLPHHSPSPITSQDHHLSPHSAHPRLHLS